MAMIMVKQASWASWEFKLITVKSRRAARKAAPVAVDYNQGQRVGSKKSSVAVSHSHVGVQDRQAYVVSGESNGLFLAGQKVRSNVDMKGQIRQQLHGHTCLEISKTFPGAFGEDQCPLLTNQNVAILPSHAIGQ